MKPCFKCHQEKELSEFHKHPKMKDGHVNKCKDCNNLDVRNNYSKNIDHFREYDKKRCMTSHRVYARKEYSKTESGKKTNSKARKRYREKYPNAYRAQRLFGKAVKSEKVTRPIFCSECPSSYKIEGHHDDYNFPLEVRWLCSKCHTSWHKKNTPLNRI